MADEMLAKLLSVVAVVCFSYVYSQNETSSNRWKRESCGDNMFKCGSNECISTALLCDGERNCEDRSDETSEICINSVIPVIASYLNPPLISYVDKCPPFEFQCENSHCIPERQRCDGRKDCGDGSDEEDCGSSCRSGEFRCESGLCISLSKLCNGLKDCADGSDETRQQCQKTRCSGDKFKCDYGACITNDAVCDQISHCADGSDESASACKYRLSSTAPPLVRLGCTLPSQPENGLYHVGGCEPPSCNVSPGTVLENFALLNYSCNRGFKLSGQSIVWCNNQIWSSSFPNCIQALCPALQNPSRYIECKFSGSNVNCSKPMMPGTKATLRCESFHIASPELSNYDITCKETGEWSNVVYNCTPECGVANPGGLPFIANGRPAKFAEFPWHVGIYKEFEDHYVQSCGGNIVSPRVVVTAAHCFWSDTQNALEDLNNFKIAAGKYYRDWLNRTRYFQESQIDKVYINIAYRGIRGLYANDIAVVILKTYFQMNEAVRPICVDLDGKYTEDFKPGVTGVVVGWGYTEDQEQSLELHAVTLPYEDRNICIERTKETFIPYINVHDKFCVGTNTGKSVCRGDSGGGFATKFRNGMNYYLMGIVSAGVAPEGNDNCDITQYSTFTRVSDYYSYIREFITV